MKPGLGMGLGLELGLGLWLGLGPGLGIRLGLGPGPGLGLGLGPYQLFRNHTLSLRGFNKGGQSPKAKPWFQKWPKILVFTAVC